MALISTLHDDFNDGVTNTSVWSASASSGATYQEAGGVLDFTLPSIPSGSSGTVGYDTLSSFDLTNSKIYVQVVKASQTNGIDTNFSVFLGSTFATIYQEDSSSINFYGSSPSGTFLTTLTYNSIAHAWWQIRHSGSTIYLETSPDGENWTTRLTSSFSGTITAMQVELSLSSISSPITVATEAKFDNLNVGAGTRSVSETASPGGSSVLVSETAVISVTETASSGGQASTGTIFQAIPQKEYEHRVYDHLWNYLGVWENVTTDFAYDQSLNQNATELNVTIGRSPDNRTIQYSVLLDTSSNPILDENSDPISVQTTTANSVGDGTDVDLNYNVEVYAFYGGYDELLDENNSPILDENTNPILSQFGAPNGLRVYSGYIADYDLKFGDTTGLDVVIVPHGTEQSHYVFKDGGDTTVSYSSVDPVQMSRDAMDNYISQGGYVTYTPASMPLSGTVSDYDFKLQTTRESIDKTIDLLPSGWYQFVDPGENIQYMKQKSATADHTFWYEKHLTSLDLRKSLTQLVNQIYFTGGDTGGGSSLFNYYEDTASISNYRRGLDRLSDARVTLDTSADIISNSEIASYKDPRYRTSIVISDAVYDIETIKLGEMVAFRNFANFVDGLLLQIVTLHKAAHEVTLDLDMVVDSDSKRLQDIYRQLRSQDTVGIPDAPSV